MGGKQELEKREMKQNTRGENKNYKWEERMRNTIVKKKEEKH